jgi:hypothetical protein
MFGATVRGPGHAREQLPNQDAWLGRLRDRHALITISDGLGSRPDSAHGSRAACRAADQAAAAWAHFPDAEPGAFIRLVHVIWELRVAPKAPADCAATCWAAVWTASGRLLVAGLGDGLALVRQPDGQVQVFSRPASEFTNQTLSLGQTHRVTDWRTLDVVASPGTVVLLATDGVADDLRPERLGDLTQWLVGDLGALPGPQRRWALQRELRNWPTPNHIDDKTLVVLWQPATT